MSQILPDLYDILRGVIICSNSSPFDKTSSSGSNLKAEFKFQSPNKKEYTLTPHNYHISVGTYILLNVYVSTLKPPNYTCSLT